MTTNSHVGRRFVVGIGVAALSVLGVTSTAEAAPPSSKPVVNPTLIEFGTYPCGFPLVGEVLQQNLTARTFTKDGVQTVRTTGVLKVRFFNDDEYDPATGVGESIVRNISGPTEVTNPDGTIDQVASGPSFTILQPNIPGAEGLPRAIIAHGRVVSSATGVDEETGLYENFTIESVSGTYEDVCAALD